MAVIRYGNAMTNFGSPLDQIHIPSLLPTTTTLTFASLTDKDGGVVNITGTGLKYSLAGITGGTVTGVELLAPGGGSLFSVTGINEPALTVSTFLLTGTVTIALLDGDDRIYGSSKRDLLVGGAGNDKVLGGGGGDFIGVMDGRDKLTGGAGSDAFIFATNKGMDTIMDFADANAASDDVIAVRKAMLDKMVTTQVGNDVLLDFGKAGTLLILNQTVAEMGADDFVTSGIGL